MDELFMNLTPWVQGAVIFSVAATILGAAVCATVASVAKARARARRGKRDEEVQEAIIRLVEAQEETLRRLASEDATRRLPPPDVEHEHKRERG